MNQLSFVDAYRTFPYILTEGAIVERLRHEFHIPLDEHLVHAALIYDDAHRDTLAGLYKQYIDIARQSRFASDADDTHPAGQMSKILLFLLIGIGVSFPIMSVFFCNCAHRPFHLFISVVWQVVAVMLMMVAIIFP